MVTDVFAQDEIALSQKLQVRVGSKPAHDNRAGWGPLPSSRLLWNIAAARQRASAAASRTWRTPGTGYRSLSNAPLHQWPLHSTLLQAAHASISDVNVGLAGSLVPRSGGFQLRWQF